MKHQQKRLRPLGIAFLAAFCLTVVAGVAMAARQQEEYKKLASTLTEGITGATGADSTTATTAITDRAIATKGNPTVAVSVDFSGDPGDTLEVSCLLYVSTDGGSTLSFIGIQTTTVTAGDYVDAAGDNIAPLALFDTGGATHVEVRHAAPSAGNVDLTWWVYGSLSGQ